MPRFEFNETEYAAMTAEYGLRSRHHFADLIEQDAKRYAPDEPEGTPRSRPGDLRTAIRQEDEDDVTLIGAELEYTAAQEEGAEAHHIPHGFGRDGGVHHPGNPEVAFLRRALYQRRAE